jgi:cell division initiation protein
MFDPALSREGQSADKRTGENTPMKVTPADIRQQRFGSTLRGFDKVEVTLFLATVADEYDQALREAERLREDVTRMELMLGEHREAEKNLTTTLITAQRLADNIRAGAEEEGRRIVAEAEARSALLLEKAQARLEDIQREMDGLKLKRKDVESTIESTIQALRNTLEFVRDQDTREHEDKILLHRPRNAEQPPEQDDKDTRKAI